MSGIAGILRFDNRRVSRLELERVANALRPYGPDRSHIVDGGSIGLVHGLMRMTPEDSSDSQPYRSASGAIITADLRLDNRDDLLAWIGIAPLDAMSWADSRVLLAAWEKLGDAVWPILRGPFAVAIWDSRLHALTLARDHLGLNPLMWHRNERFLAFASMLNGLFAFEGVPRELSEEKFADFLVLNHADHVTTIYKDVFRVLPAHVMRVESGGAVRQSRYWSPDDINPVRLPSDQAYADGLRACLSTAVRRQMRSAHPVGCLLSGGLDSSSVAVLAAGMLAEEKQRLAGFTGVPRQGFDGPIPGRYADETPHVEAISRITGNIDVTYVRDDTGDADFFADLERFFIAFGGPVRNPTNLGWVLKVLRTAHAQGRRVLLGGLYGNSTISWNGWSQAVTHLLRGRLPTAARQWQLYYRLTPYSGWTAFRKLFVEPTMPTWYGDWVERRRHPARRAAWQSHSAVRPDFAATMAVDRRARDNGHDFLYRFRSDERTRSLWPADYIGDWNAAEKAVTGVEVRDPTADIDVIAYCFGVPPEQYLAEGTDRSLIRRAMWGLLPETVLTNRLSGLQGADWYEKLGRQRPALARDVAACSQSPLARRILDLPRLERAIENWPTGGWHTPEIFTEYNLMLTRGVAAGRFLRWLEAAN